LSAGEINQIIEDKKAIYDLKVDKRVNKIGNGKTLEKFPIEKLPKYLQNNFEKYKDWID
jgi:beta-1,4-mannosyl-glycoprotein beta-1,4-N-acetylglucosaminyltransferase